MHVRETARRWQESGWTTRATTSSSFRRTRAAAARGTCRVDGGEPRAPARPGEAAPRGGRLVRVEAAAALAAEEARIRHRDEPRRRGHPRLPDLLPQRLARMDVDVDADEVEQLAP